jgi:glycosyltransferase involved in cell wall biosynthesis
VHTAAFEAWGMVIDEALAHGLPVLSTPAGALAAGRRGAQLMPAGDVAQLAAALQAWRDRPALRSAQWGAAWTARRRGWDAVVSEWEAVLGDLSSGNR